MSSLALKNEYTFAPKREVWYGDFFSAKKVRAHVIIAGILSPVLLAVVMLVSLEVFVAGANAFQAPVPVAVVPAIPAPVSPLLVSADAVTHFFHVPGAYVDTYTNVPSIEAPQFVVSKQDVAEVAPYIGQSFAETAADDWSRTFGMGSKVFVASVYEFGSDGAAVTNQELNIGEAWHEYINGLSDVLEPYVTR